MPVNVRNFWIATDIDGAKTTQAGGPRAKEGGFTTTIKMRERGQVTTAAVITGRVADDGRLRLQVRSPAGLVMWSVDTDR